MKKKTQSLLVLSLAGAFGACAPATTTGDTSSSSGGAATYEAFHAELQAKEGGATLDAAILAAFGRIESAYNGISGDAIPAVPATWDTNNPSSADFQTSYGQLFSLLSDEADPTNDGSLVHAMNAAAELLAIPQL